MIFSSFFDVPTPWLWIGGSDSTEDLTSRKQKIDRAALARSLAQSGHSRK
jgi:hypothetical protein